MNCAKQTWVGAYVLDALEPGECETVRSHIAGCLSCQDEVVRLSWLPALLRTVQLEDVQRLDARPDEDGPTQSLAVDRQLTPPRAIPSRQPWRRPAAALAGLAAAATIAGVTVFRIGDSATGRRQVVAVQTVDPRSQVHAAATLSGRRWGTTVELTLRSVPPGEHCSLIVRSRNGRHEVAATWTATYRGTAAVPGTTHIPIDQLTELDVVTSGGRQLARLVVPHHKR